MRKVGQGDALAQRFGERLVLGRQASPRSAGRPRLHARRSVRTARRSARSGRPRRDLVEQRAAALPQCPSNRGSAACRARAAPQHRAHMLGRRDHQPGVAIREVGEIAGRADRRIERPALAGKIGFSWTALIAATTSGSSAHSRRRARRWRATCASAVPQAPPPMTASRSKLMPSPPRRAPFRRPDRAASAPAPVRRARRSVPRAKRSAPAQAIIAALSVHSQPGGTLKRRPCSAASCCSAERIARLAATPPATTRPEHRCARARAGSGRRGSRPPPAGRLRRCLRADDRRTRPRAAPRS